MNFVLIGFDHSDSVRRFVFESIADDRSRTKIIVSADLAVVRRYNIQIQNLPLLCRRLLQSCDSGKIAGGSVTLSEADMEAVSKAAQENSEPRKVHRAPSVSARAGQAWRGHGTFVFSAK